MDQTIRRGLGFILLGLTMISAGLVLLPAASESAVDGSVPGQIFYGVALLLVVVGAGTFLFGLGRLIWTLLRG